jgi:hypothetical protein
VATLCLPAPLGARIAAAFVAVRLSLFGFGLVVIAIFA